MMPQALGWQPGTAFPAAADGFLVDVTNRRDVLAFHQNVYQASENYAANLGWTGNISSGNAGTTSEVFKEDVRRRVNYYRALVGLPGDIIFNATKSAKCQQAALMMSANNKLDHYPPTSWFFYTVGGNEAAGKSNLALGYYGPAAIDGYMVDPGSGNEPVGHRRWLLYPQSQEMATGDIPQSGSYNSSNVLWVIGDYKPVPPAKFVAWPNEGYVPAPVVPARWSLSYPNADFSNASVSMSLNGTNVPLTVVYRSTTKTPNYGDRTIVWEPSGLPTTVTGDLSCLVSVTGIKGSGVPTSKSYTVRVFNPAILGEQIAISGSDNPPASGEAYAFTSIDQADAYQLEIARATASSWTEGAEDNPAPRVIANISAGYELRQSDLVRTGGKAFQLAFPLGVFADQSFTIDREILPAVSSRLRYFDRARFSSLLNTMETQVSTNGGVSWTTIASRNGVNGTMGYSSEWDSTWLSRDISLAAYAGQIIRIRFILKSNNSVYSGTDSNYGFFIDDITVTDASEASLTHTLLPGSVESFTLNSVTAGMQLVAGAAYQMRVRPKIGHHWFDFGSAKTVSVTAASSPSPTFVNWASAFEVAHGLPVGTLADPEGDYDKDGRSNLVEYAFGGSPVLANDDNPRLPTPHVADGYFVLRYQVDTSLGDLVMAAEACSTMGAWKSAVEPGAPSGFTEQVVATNGGIETREARIPISGEGRCFLRVRISRQ